MDRVVITRSFLGLFYMQVCAVADATDKEILEVCNKQNPAGTIHGWVRVMRKLEDTYNGETTGQLPVPCSDNPDRIHYLVVC